MDGTDVRVIERGDGERFALKPCARVRMMQPIGAEDLDRDDALEPCIAGAIHLTHAAGADLAEQLVSAEPATDFHPHGGSPWLRLGIITASATDGLLAHSSLGTTTLGALRFVPLFSGELTKRLLR